ncbi:MAG: 30S ribosomal protein S2 [Bacteroidales bacterium]|nr:30S ribosomal protein S2 [Bacteroidales bacterium]
MPRVTFEELLEAGVHFGHLKRKWNPAMAPYIFMERNGIHIIDLEKTIEKLEEAASAMKHIARSGGKILFVATKKQAKEIVAEKVKKVNMPYVTERWPGGMLTNFPTIRKAVKKMTSIDKMASDGTFANLSKREKLQITRQRAKLEKMLGSIADLTRLPSAIFVVDVNKENIAVKEAKRLGIPVFAMVDTNSDPTNIDFPIPANDDASKSIALIVDVLCKAIEEGLNERKLEKDKEPLAKEKKDIRKELEKKAVPDSIIEAIVKEEEEVDMETGHKKSDYFDDEKKEQSTLLNEETEEAFEDDDLRNQLIK